MEAALCRGRTKRDDKLLSVEPPSSLPPPQGNIPGRRSQRPDPCANGLLRLLPRCLGW